MSLYLPRVSFWLAVIAGGLTLALQGWVQAMCAAVAVGAAFIAYAAWRADLARRLKTRRALPESLDLPWLNEVAVADAEANIARAASGAQSFEAALHAVALALQGEIGARSHRIYAIDTQVDPHREDAPVLLEMFANQAGFRATPRHFGPREDAMARAIREQREVAAFPMALAVPVCRLGQVVAVIEWRAIDIAIGLAEVARLLQATRVALDKEAAVEVGRAAAVNDDTAWPDALMHGAGQGKT